jgi:hypothetical protein
MYLCKEVLKDNSFSKKMRGYQTQINWPLKTCDFFYFKCFLTEHSKGSPYCTELSIK